MTPQYKLVGSLVPHAVGAQPGYLFKHALIQDTAYQSLLKRSRREYHHRIARVLEEQFPTTVETQPELLAHHYTEADLAAQAIPYWQQAGQAATKRAAHVEAINYLTNGIELLNTLPDSLERAQQELSLQTTLGGSLIATRGFAAAEVGDVYTRARDLCRRVGETPEIFPVMWGLCAFHTVRAEFRSAHEFAEQLLRLAESVQDPAFLIEAHYAMGQTWYFEGDFRQCRTHMEQLLGLYTREQHHALAYVYGYDPGVMGGVMLSYALWNLGYPDQALQRSQETHMLAQELNHPGSMVWAFMGAALVHQYRGEWGHTQEQAESVRKLSAEQGFALLSTIGDFQRGVALVGLGHTEVGIDEIQQAMATHHATGAKNGRPLHLALLAGAYSEMGKPDEGLSLLAEALDMGQQTGELRLEAELHRLKGALTLQRSQDAAEAETCFQKAIDIARHQQAKSWELRAAMSLARLWQGQGKTTEARALLAPVYNWFTEGFDTADLKDAKELLDQLS